MDLQQAKDLVNQAMEAYKNNDFDLAIQLWSQLEKSTDEVKEIYAKAQYNLGVVFVSLKRYQEAEQAYKNVKREDSGEGYAKAQNNLGGLLKQQQRFEESEQAYKNVSRADSVEQYARAQFNLGLLLNDLKRFDEAKKAYKNVRPDGSRKHYAWAQWNLYCSFGQNKDYLANIQKEHDLETYAEARFVLGEIEENLDAKHECWQQIPQETEQYKQEVYQIGVVKSIAELENSKYKKELFKVFENVSKVLKALFINNKYEQSIAHYTTLSVSKLLLANKDEKTKDFEPKSKLRLNTINLMNDPEEGLLINKLLCLDSRINTQDSAFIACFTLHHDSLNQFRLYGKEGQQEATGLSLVLDKEFFSTQHNTGRIYEKDVVLSHENEKGNTAKNTLAAMPLYRCIYFDPTSGLIKVAQREEWSFKREFKLEGRHHWYSENKDAESKWNEYIGNVEEGIYHIESKVKQGLEDLSKLIQDIDLGKMHSREKELLAELLLPLRYLMKHMAFKEEQECRIVYVTKMENPLVNYDGSRFYVEYEPLVMEHLEKIYLAPKAKDEKTYMEYLCAHGQVVRQHKVTKQSNGRVQVKISQNPFQ